MELNTIKLIGIGQSLRGDDAIGIISVQNWMKNYPDTACHPALQIEIAEVPGLGLLDLLSDAKFAILVDAVQTGKHPGTIHHLTSEDLASFLPDSKSAHGWGVAETLLIGKQIKTIVLPEIISIIAVEAHSFVIGETISSTLKIKLPDIAKDIQSQVTNFLSTL